MADAGFTVKVTLAVVILPAATSVNPSCISVNSKRYWMGAPEAFVIPAMVAIAAGAAVEIDAAVWSSVTEPSEILITLQRYK